jgi:hypothetical protein
MDLFWMGALRHRQHMFIQAREGLIREDLMKTHDAGLRTLFTVPCARNLWSRRQDQFIPDFVQHVDELLSGKRAEPVA